METAVAAPFAGRVRCLLAGPNEQVDTGAALVQLDATGPDPDAGHPAARLAVPETDGDDTDARARCRHDLAAAARPDARLRHRRGARPRDGRRPGRGVAHARPRSRARRRPSRMCSSPSPTCGCCSGACATRPTPTCRCAPRRSTSTPTSGRSTSKGRGCRHRSSRPCAVRSATTASTTSNGRRSSRRRCTGSTSHSSASAPRSRSSSTSSNAGSSRAPQGDTIDDGRRRTLDALVAATQRRHPVVADLAREVRFGIVDEPLLRAARDAMYAAMEEHLAALVADPAGPERSDAHMAELVDCPQPLAPLLLRRLAVDPPATHPVVLETMTRRYYRRRDPGDVRPLTVDGRDVVAAAMTRTGDGPHARAHHRRPASGVGGGRQGPRQGRRRAFLPARPSRSTCTRGKTMAR